jgi:hypothetical protein
MHIIGPDQNCAYHYPSNYDQETRMKPVSSAESMRPGLLFDPFEWAADALTAIIVAKPQLLPDLISMNCKRMHLIALALAHLDGEIAPDVGQTLISGSTRAVLELIPTPFPSRVEHVLSRYFPRRVLELETYRRLVSLLSEEHAAAFLQNTDLVSDTVINTLQNLPPQLRNSCVMNALEPITFEFGLSEGLRLSKSSVLTIKQVHSFWHLSASAAGRQGEKREQRAERSLCLLK